jgi:hypothetical protein
MSHAGPDHFDVVVERDHVRGPVFWVTGAVAIVVTIVATFVASALLRAWTHGPSAAPRTTITENDSLILWTRPGLDQRAAAKESLRHYGWVDRSRGIARIPIDRAMDLVTDAAFMREELPASEVATAREKTP